MGISGPNTNLPTDTLGFKDIAGGDPHGCLGSWVIGEKTQQQKRKRGTEQGRNTKAGGLESPEAGHEECRSVP